jgi:hypothetical protein
MRTQRLLMIAFLMLLAGALVSPASAATLLGSVSLTKASGGVESDLTTDPPDVVGTVVISNPGLEKTITQQLPPFTVPIVIDAEGSGPSLRVLRKNLDAVLLVTNPSGTAAITVVIRVWDPDGAELTPTGGVSQTLGAHATKAIRLSDLLP